MATFVYPISTANYNGGLPAVGRDVRDDLDEVRNFIVGKNIDDENIATMDGPLVWNIATNVKALDITSSGDAIPLDITHTGNSVSFKILSESDGDVVATIDRVAASTDEVSAIFSAKRSGISIFNVSPQGTLVGPELTTVARDALTAEFAGGVIYNTTDSVYQFYNGSIWQELGGALAQIDDSGAGQTIQSNSVQGYIASNAAQLTLARGVFVLLFLKPTAANSTLDFNDLANSNNNFSNTANIKWERRVDTGAGFGAWADLEVIQLTDYGGSDNGSFKRHGYGIPPQAMNTIDDSPGSIGDIVEYRIAVDSGTNIISLTTFKVVAVEV